MRNQPTSRRNGEKGIVILLVAVVLLFVVAAMAALSIDLVSFYAARSEAQLAADAAALAGARALANSGMTSDPTNTDLVLSAETQARTVAQQVAMHNDVGGRNFFGSEVSVTFKDTLPFGTDPHVTVHVTRNDLPTFFARIWGRSQVTVTASATAEAYNPSGSNLSIGKTAPVAPICVKPWLLPNINPDGKTVRIFDSSTGAIQDTDLLAWNSTTFGSRCGNGCLPGAQAWRFYPGDQSSFPAPSQALPACSTGLTTAYQLSVAGCVQQPIKCGDSVQLDLGPDASRDQETADAVNCAAHSSNDKGDSIEQQPPNVAFQFEGGTDNPIPSTRGTDIVVSDSLVTVPVFNSGVPGSAVSSPVQIIGFVQLFMNHDGHKTTNGGQIDTTVVNLAGCGTGATGQPILGNGASAIPVRLITPP